LLFPSHSSRFDHLNKIWRGVQITELLIMQFLISINSKKNKIK
jgi:hypothetical protein